MANVAKAAILRAKIEGVLTDLMARTNTANVYVDANTTLEAYLATLATNADLTALQNTVNALGALASKDEVTADDLSETLLALINGNTDAAAAAQAAAEAAQADVDVLVGNDAGKSVRTIANEELAAQLIGENAKESLDTLEEIAQWIQDHPDDASAMNAAITALQAQLKGIAAGDGTVKKYVDDAIAALSIGDYAKAADLTALAGRVTALETTANGLGDMATKDIVSESDLDAALKEKVNAAAEGNHSHANKALLDTYDQTNANIKDAVDKKHSHANQSELDKIAEGDKAKWDAAEGKAHEHSNKSVLDGITAENVTAWNGKSNIYYSATEPATMNDGDLWVQIVE